METDLVGRWREGDFEAFIELVRPHLTSVRALVAHYAPPGQAVWDYDDIAQDALVEAFRSSTAYDQSKGELKTWLYGLVRNRIRHAWQDAARARQRARKADFELRRAAAERALHNDLDADPVLQALERCLGRLPDNSREMVTAHYADGLSGDEIGKRCRMSTTAVYVALHRLRRKLRECVESSLGYSLEGQPS